MPPHADFDDGFVDSSGYTVTAEKINALNLMLKDLGSVPGAGGLSLSMRASCQVDNLDRDEVVEDFIYRLTLDETEEVMAAVLAFSSTHKLPINNITPENFPLPTLSQKLRNLSMMLPADQPFFLLKGIKPAWYTKEKQVMLFAGIASHVGTKRAMTGGDPHVLQYITAMRVPKNEPNTTYRGPPNRTMAIPFHTDYGDIISLFTLSTAVSGCSFYLADVNHIIGHLAEARSDIVKTLKEDWDIINPNAECGFDRRPLLYKLSSGGFALSASRARLTGTPTMPRPENLAPLTELQRESLDVLHAIGKKVARRFQFRSGDMIFYNNLRMMHARDEYVDGDEAQNQTKRYLLRLILKDERNATQWELPPQLKPVWSELYDHDLDEEVYSVREELFSYKISHG